MSGEEAEVARYFVEQMDAKLQPVPATPNMGPSFDAIGRLKGKGGGKSLMLNGRIDHNPTAGQGSVR
jgi:acetylornithine deacetylase